MDQEITITKDIVKFMFENPNVYGRNRARECENIIDQNVIISDRKRNIFLKYFDEIDKQESSNIKDEIRNVIQGWIDRLSLIVDYKAEAKIFDEKELCSYSNDKILLDVSLRTKSEDDLRKIEMAFKINKGASIEIHNSNTFVSPSLEHRLKNIPWSINLKVGLEYKINEFLKPYIRKVSNIAIIDPFMPNYTARHNLGLLVRELQEGTNLFLVFMTSELYVKNNRNGARAKEDYNQLKCDITKFKKIGININTRDIEKTGHKERYILTDKIQIRLPGGLDTIKKDRTANINDIYSILEIDVKDITTDTRGNFINTINAHDNTIHL